MYAYLMMYELINDNNDDDFLLLQCIYHQSVDWFEATH